MSISFAIFTLVNIWWVTLFMVLPFHIERGPTESASDYVAAPKRIHWKKIFITTTILAVIFTAAIALVIKTGIVPVR